MYTVQFISSGIVAVTLPTRGLAEDWVDCNNYGPDVFIDPQSRSDVDTGEIVPGQWVKGDCLNLFKIVRVKK